MEARDSRSKIRPLPVDDIDGDAPHRPVEPQPRRWLPLVVIVVGAIAFGVVARGLSPVAQPESAAGTTTTPPPLSAEPEPTTTTEAPPPPPPPLARLLPFANDGLRLVTIGITARPGHWPPDATEPEVSGTISRATHAEYNASGSRVAVQTAVKGGSIVIDESTGGSPIYLREDVSSGHWHPTNPDLFAWTRTTETPSGELATSVFVGDVSTYDGASLEPISGIDFEGGPHFLLGWGDWGFLIADEGQPTGPIFRYTLEGSDPIELDGVFFDVTENGTILMARVEDNGFLPYLVDADGVETELVGLDVGVSDFRITPDGAWVIAVTPQTDRHTSILARTVHSRSTRLSSVNGSARIVDLVRGGQYLVLQEADSGDLVFKDWNTGAEFRLLVESEVTAVFL